jgi:hypothetical protein
MIEAAQTSHTLSRGSPVTQTECEQVRVGDGVGRLEGNTDGVSRVGVDVGFLVLGLNDGFDGF